MVNGVNNLSKAELAQLALAKKGVKTASAQKPAWMTENGSVFNAPKTEKPAEEKTSASFKDLKNLNVDNLKNKKDCQKALDDIEKYSINPFFKGILEKKKAEIIKKKNQFSINDSQQNLQNISNGISTKNAQNTTGAAGNKKEEPNETLNPKDISASQGRAMASQIDQQKSDVENQTRQTEENTQVANKYSKDAAKDQKNIVKDQKTLQKQQKAATKDIQRNQSEITKLTDSLNSEDLEVQNLQSELERLTAGDNTGVGAKSAFSLSLAGTQENEQAQQDDPNAQRIAELQGQLSAKTSSMQKTGARIGKLQTQTNKQIKTMHKVSTKFISNINRTQASLETNQKASDKILNIANKVEEISTLVATGGTALKYAGKGLMALGASMSWAAGAGAALIAAGKVMNISGTVAEIAGQYGQAAAGITKTACYAAQGNLAGALMSAGSAVMAGTSAVKGTKELGNTFKQISEQATQATQKLAAGVTARETVKNMTEEQLGGLSRKQARKVASKVALENIQGQAGNIASNVAESASSSFFDKAMTVGNKLQTAGAVMGKMPGLNGQKQTQGSGNQQQTRGYAPVPKDTLNKVNQWNKKLGIA